MSVCPDAGGISVDRNYLIHNSMFSCQVLGKVPTISVEKTDGCQMFLNAESVGAEIVTAKSSEMNVMIPQGDEFVEQPVPEQFKTVISGGKLVTSATESV